MKVVGFTFIRNAIQYDFPIVEAVQSILPLCEKVVIAVGKSEDDTLAYLKKTFADDADKIEFLETVWDDSLREGGQVLALETDKAFAALPTDADWCIYIQGDEVLPESSHGALLETMRAYEQDSKVEGIVLNYLHFYGSYHYIADSRKWYRREVRVIRRRLPIQSWKDAQGFRSNGSKLKVKLSAAIMHHYGWVKEPMKQQAKRREFETLWHGESAAAAYSADTYDYTQIDSLSPFTGQHPQVMQQRVNNMNWSFNPPPRALSLKERFSRWVEQLTGWRIGEYRNYEL